MRAGERIVFFFIKLDRKIESLYIKDLEFLFQFHINKQKNHFLTDYKPNHARYNNDAF